jgi:hypothetical protein
MALSPLKVTKAVFRKADDFGLPVEVAECGNLSVEVRLLGTTANPGIEDNF